MDTPSGVGQIQMLATSVSILGEIILHHPHTPFHDAWEGPNNKVHIYILVYHVLGSDYSTEWQ